jgi:hypothetical protein
MGEAVMRTVEKPEVLSVVVTIVAALVALLAVRSVFDYFVRHLVLASIVVFVIVGVLAYIAYKNNDTE